MLEGHHGAVRRLRAPGRVWRRLRTRRGRARLLQTGHAGGVGWRIRFPVHLGAADLRSLKAAAEDQPRQVDTGDDAAAQYALHRGLRPGAPSVASRIGHDQCGVEPDAPQRPVEVQAADVQRVYAVGLSGDFAGGPVAQQLVDQRRSTEAGQVNRKQRYCERGEQAERDALDLATHGRRRSDRNHMV